MLTRPLLFEVCKKFRDLIVGTASLQYIIELAVSGQRDGPYISGMSSVTKLERLRKHQEAWKKPSWSREIEIPMLDGDTWELCGGVLGQTTGEGGFHFYRLPSDLRGIREARWTLEPRFEFRVCDFTMDPGQDLLVLVESSVAVLGCRWFHPGFIVQLMQLFHCSIQAGSPPSSTISVLWKATSARRACYPVTTSI